MVISNFESSNFEPLKSHKWLVTDILDAVISLPYHKGSHAQLMISVFDPAIFITNTVQ